MKKFPGAKRNKKNCEKNKISNRISLWTISNPEKSSRDLKSTRLAPPPKNSPWIRAKCLLTYIIYSFIFPINHHQNEGEVNEKIWKNKIKLKKRKKKKLGNFKYLAFHQLDKNSSTVMFIFPNRAFLIYTTTSVQCLFKNLLYTLFCSQ